MNDVLNPFDQHISSLQKSNVAQTYKEPYPNPKPTKLSKNPLSEASKQLSRNANQLAEECEKRRTRNRESARRSRLKKKQLLQDVQAELIAMTQERDKLLSVVCTSVAELDRRVTWLEERYLSHLSLLVPPETS
jgi:hypothetical protein